jgi:transcriptional regulator with XRE-family HTH domain
LDRVKIGNTFRAIRVDMRLRQRDVAERAGVSQQTVSKIERGRFGDLSIDAYCRVAAAIDADIALAPRWRGPKLDRILDRRHVLLQNGVVELLTSLGWEVRTEFSFNCYGDRGDVDILAWSPGARALLIIEIKTEITDLQATLRVLNMKRRVVPDVVAGELGWRGVCVATVLALPGATTHRALVERHSALVSASLPRRTVSVRRWLAAPLGDLRGVWFLPDTSPGGAKLRLVSSGRVRAADSARLGTDARPNRAQPAPVRASTVRPSRPVPPPEPPIST